MLCLYHNVVIILVRQRSHCPIDVFNWLPWLHTIVMPQMGWMGQCGWLLGSIDLFNLCISHYLTFNLIPQQFNAHFQKHWTAQWHTCVLNDGNVSTKIEYTLLDTYWRSTSHCKNSGKNLTVMYRCYIRFIRFPVIKNLTQTRSVWLHSSLGYPPHSDWRSFYNGPK